MDEQFKVLYEIHMFQHICELEPEWKKQVINLHEFWEDTGKLIGKEQFTRHFNESCDELLCYEVYDLEEAFTKTTKEWKEELMIKVAERIIAFHDSQDSFCDHVVSIENGYIRVDTTMCKSLSASFYL